MTDSKTKIKDRFRSGAIPSERDFAALIDLMVSTDVFESTIASLREQKDESETIAAPDTMDQEVAILRREKEELEARIDREIAILKEERGAIEPLLHRPDLHRRREIETTSDFIDREISALKDERQGLRLRQDHEIAMLRRVPRDASLPQQPAPREPKDSSVASPSLPKRQIRADGSWQSLQVDHPLGAFSITATMNSPANVAATWATVVMAGPTLKPNISQRKCYDRAHWLLLVPLGIIAVALGAYLVWTHGITVWQEPWSAAGLWLALVGIAAAVIGIVFHHRRALSISWQRKGGPLALSGPGTFVLRSNGRFNDGDNVPLITYAVTALDG